MIDQHLPAKFGEVIDVRVEISLGDLALLRWQVQVACFPQDLQTAQRRVPATMRVAGQLVQKLRRLRPVPVNVRKPAQLARGRNHIDPYSGWGSETMFHALNITPSYNSGEGASGSSSSFFGGVISASSGTGSLWSAFCSQGSA